ncbi:MAG: LCP family protein [Actinomycetota bacterium]
MAGRSRERLPIARHGQLRSPRALGQLAKGFGIAIAIVLVSALGVGAYLVTDLSNTVTANSVELEGQQAVPPDIGEYEGGFDILVAGLDTCEEEYAELLGKRCIGRTDEGTLNDVNLLIHVSDDPRRITAVSFPRDLMVPIPPCGDGAEGTGSTALQPLNTAYAIGGLSCVAKTISEFSGQDVEFATSVTFGGVIEITDAIGGVDVCLANGINDPLTGLNMEAGDHTVEGLEALQFLRTRKGVGDGSDLGRIGNQQQYMSSLARKLISSEVLGDVPTMLRLANTALSNLETSTSLAENPMTIVQIALAVKDVDFSDIVFVQYPNGSSAAYPNKVVPIPEAGAALWEAIEANRPLEITHENNSNEGVVVTEDDPEETAPEPSETATPTDGPDEDTDEEAVALPESIKGNTAAQRTCSNGNVR